MYEEVCVFSKKYLTKRKAVIHSVNAPSEISVEKVFNVLRKDVENLVESVENLNLSKKVFNDNAVETDERLKYRA